LLASSVGYGFITKLSELYTKNRAGKSVLNLPQGATPLPPLTVHSLKTDLLVSISNEGRLLIFPVSHLPILPRGKGNKIISVFPKKEETLKHLFLLPHNTDLIIIAGKRRMTLQADSLDQYRGERGRRGQKLPQGFRRVDGLESGESETNSVEDHQSSIFEL
jgi:topoisomerase-4 subunit A